MTRRADRQQFVFVVSPTRTGRLWRAHLQDDTSVVAHGETAMRAISALAEHLDDEDARANAQPRPIRKSS